MGPPSQQGKFRPKKPPKKKSAPPPAAAAAIPDVAGSSSTTAASTSVDFAPATAAGRASSASGGYHGGSGRGRGGRGRGRGDDRGGRGRGRSRAPTGTTFFTASDKPSSAKVKKKRNLDKKRRTDEGDEDIVGTLEVGVGDVKGGSGKKKATPIKKENLLDSMDRMEYNEDGYGGGGGGGSASNYVIDGAMYDSDSSKEEARGKQRNEASSKGTQPLKLPFPIPKIPLGVGQSERPTSYEIDSSGENQNVASDMDVMDEEDMVKSDDSLHAEASASPFVNVNQKQDLLWEQNNWFLVQLPTRLPSLKKQQASSTKEDDVMNDIGDSNNDSMMDVGDGNDAADQSASNKTANIADVATPPIVETSFDNVLTRTAPGRIGKMKVYRSGKTVLVLESQDGSKEVQLNVHEGLTCGFLQQAVAIDMDKSKYISLGDVTKSVVISPNLD